MRPRCVVPTAETEVARREVKLLVVERIVRDVHLAVTAHQRAVRVEDDGRVVIKPRRAPLEKRGDDDHAQLLRQRAEQFAGRAGDCLRELRNSRGPPPGRNIARRKVRAGRRYAAPWRAASRIFSTARMRFSSGSRGAAHLDERDRQGLEGRVGIDWKKWCGRKGTRERTTMDSRTDP